MKLVRSLLLGIAAAGLVAGAVYAGNTTLFSSQRGDIVFPISPPTASGPGAIDNMTIGATTPRPATVTTLSATTLSINGSNALVCATFAPLGAPAAATDTVFFIATRAYTVVSISEVHAVAAGGASSLQVTKDTGTDAPGAGTNLLTNNTNAGFDLNATANTVQVGTLVTTAGVTTLAAGNRLAVDFANAIQSSSGIAVTACMAPI